MTIHQDSRRKATQARPRSRRSYGFPLWVSLLILCAALAVGTIVTLSAGQLGIPFLTIFVVAALVVAVLTEPRGLFLIVASMPMAFMLFAVLTSYLLVKGAAPAGTPVSKTQIVTSLYPFIQHFPVLALTTVAAGIVAYLRLALLRRSDRISTATAQQRRRQQSEAQLRNTTAARKARSQSQRARRSHSSSQPGTQVTVEELMRRRQERAAAKAQRPSRSAGEQRLPGADSAVRSATESGRRGATQPAQPARPAQQARPEQPARPRKSFNDDLYK